MYTTCPECGTVFRIATNDLRAAEGHVRCGHCSATFNAVATLSDEPPASARPIPAREAEPAPATDDTAQSEDTLEFDIPEDSWATFFTDDTGAQGRREPVIAEMPSVAVDLPSAGDEPGGPATLPEDPGSDTIDQPGPIPALAGDSADISLGDDESWQALLQEVEDDSAVTDSVYVIEADTPQDVAEPDVTTGVPWEEPAPDANGTPAPLPADFADVLPADRRAGPGFADGAGDVVPPVAETPGPPEVIETFAWTPPGPDAGVRPRRRWPYAVGSLLLALTLVIQVLHQQRDELATNPALTEPLQRLYKELGMPLWPAWDLRAYEVRNYEAVADRTSRGALDILARIAVVGDHRVGLPLVRVTLTDRFGQSLGSRVFGPDEYLGGNPRPREPVRPGTLIPVEISLKDPGTSAQGFDVDVCLMTQRDGMTCQSKREPFAR
jgi:predicted Zn finger-like uncharacterized protein